MSDAKPYTAQQREQVQQQSEAWGWDTDHIWPNSVVLSLLATLAEVDYALAEARLSLAASQARERALREALEDNPAWIRALGEYGPQIVIESEQAQDARWTHDPGFVTKLAEVIRVYADAMASGEEKRHADLLASPPDDSALRALMERAWDVGFVERGALPEGGSWSKEQHGEACTIGVARLLDGGAK